MQLLDIALCHTVASGSYKVHTCSRTGKESGTRSCTHLTHPFHCELFVQTALFTSVDSISHTKERSCGAVCTAWITKRMNSAGRGDLHTWQAAQMACPHSTSCRLVTHITHDVLSPLPALL